MGLLKKLLCKHPNVMYFEGQIDLFVDGTRIRRLIYCPDCELTFFANKAHCYRSSIHENRKDKTRKNKIRDMK